MPTAARRAVRISFILLLSALAAIGQTLGVNPVSVARGSANIFRLVLKPDPDRPLTALQWEFVFPPGLRIEPAGIVPGPAAEAAGKSIHCAERASDGKIPRLFCILVGGIQPLSAGALAIVRVDAERGTAKGAMAVGLERLIGVSPSIEIIPIADTIVRVTVR